jgi:hypothetical protein
MTTDRPTSALRHAIIVGSALQLAMVVSGHWLAFVKMNLFAVGGMAISFVAGVLYARRARVARGASAVNGALAGGVCALIGIAVSYLLGDVPAAVLALGTLTSGVTGAIGGAIAGGVPRAAAAALLVALVSSRGFAQAGRGPSAQGATATTADLAWLRGSWEGRLANAPGTAELTFMAPRAGLIAGVMRLVDGDRILVVELITIVDTPTGPEMRFRHFSSTLEPYEATFRQSMRLTAHTGERDDFENQVPFDARLISTQPRVTSLIRRGADEFVGHTDTLDEHGQAGVVEVTYRRR